MSWYDVEESRLGVGIDAATSMADTALEGSKNVPFLGSAVSLLQAAYHTGSAVYDGATGDRDGAVDHGAQAAVNAMGAIPGFGDLIENVDAGASMLGLGAREATHMAGGDASQIPDGLDSLAGSWAVGATNAMFGRDDSNWFADGDTPQGTRQGEIAAGVNMMVDLPLAMMGVPMGLLRGSDDGLGGDVASAAGTLFGSESKPGTTSGAGGGWAADAGRWINDELGGTGGGAVGGSMLGAFMYGPMGALGGLGVGAAAGYLEENGMPDLGGLMPDLGGGSVPGTGPGLWQSGSPDLGGGSVPGTGPGLWQSGLPDLGGGGVPGTGPGLWQSGLPDLGGGGVPGVGGPGLWQDSLPDMSALDPIIAGLGMPGMLLSGPAPSGGGAGAAMGATQGQVAGGGAAGGAAAGSVGTVPGAGAAAGGAAAGTGKARPTGGDIGPYLPPMFESVGDLF